MSVHYMLCTEGTPLTALRGFLRALYEQAGLDGLVLPMFEENAPVANVVLRLVQDPNALGTAAVLSPYMPQNAAALIPQLAREHPKARLGAVLRACEMRALQAVAEREPLDLDRWLIIGADCLGTHPLEDDSWLDDVTSLTEKTLRYARQGGIAMYRYRAACQICVSPVCDEAEISIGMMGLPVDRALLITARDKETAQRLNLKAITHGKADPELVDRRQRTRTMLEERRAHTREKVLAALDHELAADLEAFITHLEGCETCKDSLLVCPICTSGESLYRDDGGVSREAVRTWLSACAGCGMCEQQSAGHLPLAAIFQKLKAQIGGMAIGRQSA